MTTNKERLLIASQIVNWEARRDSQGHFVVYKLPAGDGGGEYEVAGINNKYHPVAAKKLKDLVENKQYDQAESYATAYIAEYTDKVKSWTSVNGIEAFLRDSYFNRGPTGSARIFQIALKVRDNGDVGTTTLDAARRAESQPRKLLQDLREAREFYERKVVKRDESSIFWKGLVNRWNKALKFSLSLLESRNTMKQYRVAARAGARLRSGPGTEFDVIDLLAFDSRLFLIERRNEWAKVDIQNDGAIDGFVFASLLEPVDDSFISDEGVADPQLYIFEEDPNPFPDIVNEIIERDQIGSIFAWQHILNCCGYYPVLQINGQNNPETIAKTKEFQHDNGLLETGIVDFNTWNAGIEHDKLPDWTEKLILPVTQSTTQNLYEYYSQRRNYDKVDSAVMDWYGSRKNACVAFISTALRQLISEDYVPIANGPDGNNISLWTKTFSLFLRNEKGWKKFTDESDLIPGDIIFTVDGQFGEGVPNHVYMFSGWFDQEDHRAWAIDNQGFKYKRNTNRIPDGKSAFAYFLRA
jgi:peptidoglycan hydrolase-like protein with peptidoglycan-binding domain